MIIMYKKILAGVDGSETSMKALQHAIDLAEVHGSELHIISVLEEFKLPFASQYELWASESHDEHMTRVLEEMNSALMRIKREDVEIDVETRIEKGRPATVITTIADDEGFDLILVGAKGMGKVEELLLGSVSREIIDISRIPVLIVK
jgi:nucleotide-binding universal stress UspA family protein